MLNDQQIRRRLDQLAKRQKAAAPATNLAATEADLPAAGAAHNGQVWVITATGDLVVYAGGQRFRVAGAAF